jgi:hypothetical protein
VAKDRRSGKRFSLEYKIRLSPKNIRLYLEECEIPLPTCIKGRLDI